MHEWSRGVLEQMQAPLQDDVRNSRTPHSVLPRPIPVEGEKRRHRQERDLPQHRPGNRPMVSAVILSPLLLPFFCCFSRLFAGGFSLVALAGNRFSLSRPFLACLQRSRRFSSQRTQTREIRKVDFRLLRYRFSTSWDGT